ncbi:MAG TPA: immunoglobulin domain-containing protein, partial [Flavobacteriales bacterium]|nr:immunoglobulin domain-containing protein [Flavobacteriales bacterium]
MRTTQLVSTLALVASIGSQAQTVRYVTSPFDSGTGTFRNVVAEALSGDTIRFQITGTITLLTGTVTYDKDLVIDGPGMDLLTVSGNDQSVVLNITGHSSRISGISIAHGVFNGGGSMAGGLNFSGDTLRVESVRFADCRNQGVTSSKAGGGAYIAAVRVRMNECAFENNTVSCQGGNATAGGAFLFSDDILLQDVTFTNNAVQSAPFADNSTASGGGLGIYGRAKMMGCTFTGNSVQSIGIFVAGVYYDARSRGGAFYADNSHVEFENCVLTANQITSTAQGDPSTHGAGVYTERGDVHMTSCNISNNVATLFPANPGSVALGQGGGIYLQNGYLTVEDCTLDSNQTLDGTGIYHDIGTDSEPRQGITVRRTRVTHGIGTPDRAAIVTALVDRVDLFEVELSDNAQYSLAIGADTIRVDRCLFHGNHGGASLYNPNTNETHILNTTFTRSAVASSALYANSTTFYLINCTMVDDSLTVPGARELALDNSTVLMKNTILAETWFHGNNAFAQNGGSVISAGGNVCGDGSLAAYLTQPNDVNNTQPGLGGFLDNGGFTRTWSLLGNSTCIDRGGADTLTFDQRGFLRDASSDAGAFEYGSEDPAIVIASVSPDLLVCNGHLLEVTATASSGATLSYQWYLNGDPIAGANSAAYSTTADLTDAGNYTCSIWNAVDSVVAGPV